VGTFFFVGFGRAEYFFVLLVPSKEGSLRLMEWDGSRV
jgi:hypothetical protein